MNKDFTPFWKCLGPKDPRIKFDFVFVYFCKNQILRKIKILLGDNKFSPIKVVSVINSVLF